MKLKIIVGASLAGVVIVAGLLWYVNRPPDSLPPASADERMPDGRTPASVPQSKETATTRNPSDVPANSAPPSGAARPTGAMIEDRVRALRNLPSNLNAADLDQLYTQLRQPVPEDETASGKAYKNEIMDKLCEIDPPGVAGLLKGVYEDRNQNAIVRDYALQHLIERVQRMTENESGRIPRGELNELTRILWEAVRETDGTIAGTALLGLSRLSVKLPDLDPARVALTAGKLASDPAVGAMTRTTAIQVCVQLGVTDALPAIWQAARSGDSLPLRASAIGALGRLDGTNAVPYLTELTHSDTDSLKPAAKQALVQIARAERQKALDLQEQLEKQRADEFNRRKAHNQ